MKLQEHVNIIRELIYRSFVNQFARWGVGEKRSTPIEELQSEIHNKRIKIDQLIESHIGETKSREAGRDKALDELTFTLFNRIAAIKVMEAHALFPEIITKRAEHGGRSYSHKFWLEQNPQMRTEELEGLRAFLKYKFNELGEEINLFHRDYPYAILPYVIDLNEIIAAFNAVEKDTDIDKDIWKSDDILGWLYESYNNSKKKAFKESKKKVEYDKVSLQSQVYTPRWVVKFLLDNSLGKLYMEMFPNSEIKNRYKIANIPDHRIREPKALHEIKIIDPAPGSGNFLLYAFDLFYDLYLDQIENYGASYLEKDIAKLIIENNLHGIDLDDRSIQLAQLGLYIKAMRKNRHFIINKINIVSSDFYLPDYEHVKSIFESGENLDAAQKQLLQDIWEDLRNAYKFGSLIRVEEKINARISYWKSLFERKQLDAFRKDNLASEEIFRENFFENLFKAIQIHGMDDGKAFLLSKTKDAITYLKIISDKYDLACTNPPYTDSSDFGEELKIYIDANYKKPYGFHTNLFASFIKRCYDLCNDDGRISLVHPPTFMYIKTFEGVRKFILEKTHIDLFVEWGYLGMFNPSARVDSAVYILDKNHLKKDDTIFIKLDDLYETKRLDALMEAYNDYFDGKKHQLVYTLPQYKLKIIKSWPFIYWISDKFREKFKEVALENKLSIVTGLGTGDNIRFLRYWWEIGNNDIILKNGLSQKWVKYAKGGESNKWHGNLWLVVNWENDGEAIINCRDSNGKQRSRPQNRKYYFQKGITCSGRSSSKGMSYRLLPEDFIFDVGATGIFLQDNTPIQYYIGFLNSKLISYVIDCLNPTVNTSEGDVRRIPFIQPSEEIKIIVSELSNINIETKKHFCSFKITEYSYDKNPIIAFTEASLQDKLIKYLNIENARLSLIHINEAIIDHLIFEAYNLCPEDRLLIETKMGKPIGELPILTEAREAYLSVNIIEYEIVSEFIQNLPLTTFEDQKVQSIKAEFSSLYQSNNDLEEFCIRNHVNPINVWYWFKERNILPKQRAHEITMEFLADIIRNILDEDEDGIAPLVRNTGEETLQNRIEKKCYEKGLASAQFSQLEDLLGRNLNEYLDKHFFQELSNHLNFFPNLPRTPFIWHLTAGEYQGFDVYIIIYKWNRDKLYRLKSIYIEKRERALINCQADLKDDFSVNAQNEKDLIYKQLKEIAEFKKKIDELLSEGYDPVLDDGVGKNIAPLQKKGMLAYDVLNVGQLEKYLNSDW